jgi:hypothetical protein
LTPVTTLNFKIIIPYSYLTSYMYKLFFLSLLWKYKSYYLFSMPSYFPTTLYISFVIMFCYYIYYCIYFYVGRNSSVCIATELSRYRDRIPMWARFFAHPHTGLGSHPASCTIGTGSFPETKRPGRGADHPPPSIAEVKKE